MNIVTYLVGILCVYVIIGNTDGKNAASLPLTLDPNETLSAASFNRLITAKYWRIGNIPMPILFAYYDVLGIDAMFRQLAQTPSGEFRACHTQAHNMGKLFFFREEHTEASYAYCNRQCQGGCMHGFLMQSMYNITGYKEGTDYSLLSPVEDSRVKQSLKEFYFNACGNGNTTLMRSAYFLGTIVQTCYHGLGHAVTSSVAGYKLRRALDECKAMESFGESPAAKVARSQHKYIVDNIVGAFKAYMCATGVYMEFFTSGPFLSYLSDRTSFAPCSNFDEFPAGCYRYVIIRNFGVNDIANVSHLCETISHKHHRWGCFFGIGLQMLRYLWPFNSTAPIHRSINYLCQFISDWQNQRMCLYGASFFMAPAKARERASAGTNSTFNQISNQSRQSSNSSSVSSPKYRQAVVYNDLKEKACRTLQNRTQYQWCLTPSSELVYFFQAPELFYSTQEMTRDAFDPFQEFQRPLEWNQHPEPVIAQSIFADAEQWSNIH